MRKEKISWRDQYKVGDPIYFRGQLGRIESIELPPIETYYTEVIKLSVRSPSRTSPIPMTMDEISAEGFPAGELGIVTFGAKALGARGYLDTSYTEHSVQPYYFQGGAHPDDEGFNDDPEPEDDGHDNDIDF